MQNVIVLNGPSSAGKTSITKALQAKLETPYFHHAIDTMWDMIPASWEEGSKNFPKLKYVFFDTAKSLLDHGHDVIIDTVFMPETVEAIKPYLAAHNAFYVAVTASLPTLIGRQNHREDRQGKVEQQFQSIPGPDELYDLIIDTTNITAEKASARILAAFTPK